MKLVRSLSKARSLVAGVVATVMTVLGHAQTVTPPDMAAKVETAGTTITNVQVIVASTAVFFTVLAIYKWVKRK